MSFCILSAHPDWNKIPPLIQPELSEYLPVNKELLQSKILHGRLTTVQDAIYKGME